VTRKWQARLQKTYASSELRFVISTSNGTGRIVTSFGPLVVGLLVAPFGGNFGTAAGVMTCFALLSILAVAIGNETKDEALSR
jgi:hypothetical protein